MPQFTRTQNDPVPHLCCSLIPTPHGFFGRAGGISTLPHLATLNIGAFLGDEIDTIKHNRSLLIGALGGDPAHGIVRCGDEWTAYTRAGEEIARWEIF